MLLHRRSQQGVFLLLWGVGRSAMAPLPFETGTFGDGSLLRARKGTACAFGSPGDGEVEGAVIVLLNS